MKDYATPSWITVDTRIWKGPLLLHGFVVVSSTDGGSVTLYDGQDAGAGTLLGTYRALENSPLPVMFPKPVRLDRGLYADIGATMTGVLIVWEPL